MDRADDIGSVDSFRPLGLRPKVDVRDFRISVERKILEIDRLNQIKAQSIASNTFVSSQAGKVLIFYPERGLADGLMEIESGGFIDSDDLPPSGTWFYFALESTGDNGCALYAWIPEAFVSIVDRALGVDQYSCLEWF